MVALKYLYLNDMNCISFHYLELNPVGPRTACLFAAMFTTEAHSKVFPSAQV